MKLMLISSSDDIKNEHEVIKAMFDLGLPTFHLRKPHFSAEHLKTYLNEFSKEHLKKIIIHTHHSLAWDFRLKGIHLTKSDRKKKYRSWLLYKLLKLKQRSLIRSTSCSSLSSLTSSYKDFDYIMLTPVFAGVQEHRPTFSRGTLHSIVKKYPNKIVARGGAKVDNIEKGKEIGFTGIAFHNSIWRNPDPLKELERAINKYKELGIPIE